MEFFYFFCIIILKSMHKENHTNEKKFKINYKNFHPSTNLNYNVFITKVFHSPKCVRYFYLF